MAGNFKTESLALISFPSKDMRKGRNQDKFDGEFVFFFRCRNLEDVGATCSRTCLSAIVPS